ncbi:uncharacterized protein TRIADDRAFT_53645 [Trichoplax adhaerens]|uniref:Fibronectin type-III domain-containing protein n=1 Tax=Trichoplax adhaerens TaxID=10228 RepID=B3RPS4_TRIAD|nr:hypothetical protein TRIADDRAFT_53645 [Trichoplax adhaerens]EDV28235.1 hypothetical protein TRIADDRAFT_53645 [Trichoplax adhaerens]|eukprot:XP_002110069.1 hypothetical protein TRIADDRAFT_53645 [Trichoplax adhaerens]
MDPIDENVKDVKVHNSLLELIKNDHFHSKFRKTGVADKGMNTAVKQCKVELFDTLAKVKRVCNQIDDKMGKHAYYVAKMTANASDTRRQLTAHFTKARKAIVDALEKRLDALLAQVEAQEHRHIKPFLNQQENLATQLASGIVLMEEGKLLLKSKDAEVLNNKATLKQKNLKFLEQSGNSLNEQSGQLRSILVNLNDRYLNSILDAIQSHCFVSEIPVIVKMVERPGAFYIEWSEHNDDTIDTNSQSDKEYQLQIYEGDIYEETPGKVKYETVYSGRPNYFVVRDLLSTTTYSFRVRSRPSPFSDWGMWSEPKTGRTAIPSHKWALENFRSDPDAKMEYEISSEGRTATRISSEVATILRSSGTCYILGETITLIVSGTGKSESSDAIGLANNRVDFVQRNLRQPGAIYISSSGLIYKDGNALKNKLPPLRRGNVISICAQEIMPKRLRVSFTIGERQITIEWYLPEPEIKLYFAICFRHVGWSVTVD